MVPNATQPIPKPGFIRPAIVVLWVFFLAGRFNRLGWPFEIPAHLSFQVLLAAIGLVGAALLTRRWAWMGVAALLVAVTAMVPAPWLMARPAVPGAGDSLSLFYGNVLRVNDDHSRVSEQITHLNPDVICLTEVDRGWLADLDATLDGYTHRVELPDDNNFGMALYSKRPLLSSDSFELGPPLRFDHPAISVSLLLGEQPISIVFVHAVPPVDRRWTAHRNIELKELADRVNASVVPVIVVGDLNTTMYTRAYARLVDSAGLRDLRRGRGLLGTWPAGMPGSLRLPIDHVLISDELTATSLEVGGSNGSDHLPLLVTIQRQHG